MIEVNKINGKRVLVNPDLIRYIESTPDTVLTFTDGERVMVQDKPDELVKKIIRYRQECGQPSIKESSDVRGVTK
jgi:flagellar protein FlbD